MLAAHPVSRTRRPHSPPRLRIYSPPCEASRPPLPPSVAVPPAAPRSGELQPLGQLMPQVLARYGIVKSEN